MAMSGVSTSHMNLPLINEISQSLPGPKVEHGLSFLFLSFTPKSKPQTDDVHVSTLSVSKATPERFIP